MSRTFTLAAGAVLFALALGAAVIYSDRGTPDATEGAPANVPASPAAPNS